MRGTRLLSWSAWIAVDWAVATYVLGVALLCAGAIPQWRVLVVGHGVLLVALLLMPPRGAPWEYNRVGATSSQRGARRLARFLRYSYPALLVTPFFEEVWLTVNATSPDYPYWFESYLYIADRWLFGTTPAVALSAMPATILDELMHGFYLSYYPLIISGIVIAWLGPTRGKATPGPGFHAAMTSMILGFLFAFAWHPFLPARGPWENATVMSGLRPFDGLLFTPLVQWIIDGAAVSGGCFPSAHISGTVGLIVGLAPTHRKLAGWFGLVTVGIGVSCVYTRYHHAVDVRGCPARC